MASNNTNIEALIFDVTQGRENKINYIDYLDENCFVHIRFDFDMNLSSDVIFVQNENMTFSADLFYSSSNCFSDEWDPSMDAQLGKLSEYKVSN